MNRPAMTPYVHIGERGFVLRFPNDHWDLRASLSGRRWHIISFEGRSLVLGPAPKGSKFPGACMRLDGDRMLRLSWGAQRKFAPNQRIHVRLHLLNAGADSSGLLKLMLFHSPAMRTEVSERDTGAEAVAEAVQEVMDTAGPALLEQPTTFNSYPGLPQETLTEIQSLLRALNSHKNNLEERLLFRVREDGTVAARLVTAIEV